MRQNHRIQPTLTEPWLDLPRAKELKTISDLLDQHPMLGALVAQDLATGKSKQCAGLTGGQALRALVIKQMNGFSYEELAFHLADSQTYRRFCLFGITDQVPKRSTLAENIKRISASTLEQVNRTLVEAAIAAGVERGRKVRIDSTVVETNIHPPSDSALLFDCVRVLTRLMATVKKLGVEGAEYSNRTRRAKRRWIGIHRARRKRHRRRLYRDLVNVTEEVVTMATGVLRTAQGHKPRSMDQVVRLQATIAELEWYLSLTKRVLDQTRRRVFNGEVVPASEKLVSIFEEHSDIIVKAPRETQFGHKVTLTGGSSSMILDCVISEGNPADSSLADTMIDRQIDIYGRPPLQASFDGGYASKDNLQSIKAMGVKDVAFHKKRGLEVSDMVKSLWVYRQLRNFRAGIEGCISFIKRIFGLSRCTWCSFPSFQSYIWGSIISFNLLVMARLLST
jgi:transposase, IS5 family